MKRRLVPIMAVLVAVLLALLGLWWYAPVLTLRALAQAIERKDTQAIARYVDFPRVREGLKAQLQARLMQEVQKDVQSDTTGFAALGAVLAVGFIGPMVEAAVDLYLTPEGLASLGVADSPKEGRVEWVRNWRVFREGFSRAILGPSREEGLILERQGLWRWRVVGIRIGDLSAP